MSRKSPRKEIVEKLSKVSDIDWARMAAYLDGEGSIGVYISNKPKCKGEGASPRYVVNISVANCDPRLLAWVKERFLGGVYITKASTPKHRTRYLWIAVAHLAVSVLKGCLPYFVIKREQAEIALAVQETMRYSTHVLNLELLQRREELRLKLSAMKREHIAEDFKFVQ